VRRSLHQCAEARAGELAERHPDQLDAEEEEAEAQNERAQGRGRHAAVPPYLVPDTSMRVRRGIATARAPARTRRLAIARPD